MPSIPEYLADLSLRAQAAIAAVEQARSEPREELVSRVERARTDAERMADALAHGVIAAEQEASIRWSKVLAGWKDHVLSMRSHVRDQLAGRDAETLTKRAQYADAYAQATAALAAAAIQEAEYAVLDAALARADARRGPGRTPPDDGEVSEGRSTP